MSLLTAAVSCHIGPFKSSDFQHQLQDACCEIKVSTRVDHPLFASLPLVLRDLNIEETEDHTPEALWKLALNAKFGRRQSAAGVARDPTRRGPWFARQTNQSCARASGLGLQARVKHTRQSSGPNAADFLIPGEDEPFFSFLWQLEELDSQWTILFLLGTWIFPKYLKCLEDAHVAEADVPVQGADNGDESETEQQERQTVAEIRKNAKNALEVRSPRALADTKARF